MSTSIFQFEGQRVRHVVLDGEPWFVAADVCRCLGLGVKNVTNHAARLAPDERQVTGLSFSKTPITIVSRPGLFKLIQRSNKPEAMRFDRLVRHEILPSIMDTGSYTAPGAIAPNVIHTMDQRDRERIQAAMVAPYGSQMYQGDGLDLVELVARQEARIDALIAHIGGLVALMGREPSPSPEEGPEGPPAFDDKDHYTAREVVGRLCLAGFTPSDAKATAKAQDVGRHLSAMIHLEALRLTR